MTRFAILLALLAALTGTPLQQAEAAADFVREFTEPVDSAGLETPDGGVGDDSEVVTFTEVHTGFAADVWLAAAPFFLPPVPSGSIITSVDPRFLRERVGWPLDPPKIRNAWLQTFLF